MYYINRKNELNIKKVTSQFLIKRNLHLNRRDTSTTTNQLTFPNLLWSLCWSSPSIYVTLVYLFSIYLLALVISYLLRNLKWICMNHKYLNFNKNCTPCFFLSTVSLFKQDFLFYFICLYLNNVIIRIL